MMYGSQRDGAPQTQPPPFYSPFGIPQANSWNGNQLNIPGQTMPQPWDESMYGMQGNPMGGLAGMLGGQPGQAPAAPMKKKGNDFQFPLFANGLIGQMLGKQGMPMGLAGWLGRQLGK